MTETLEEYKTAVTGNAEETALVDHGEGIGVEALPKATAEHMKIRKHLEELEFPDGIEHEPAREMLAQVECKEKG